MSSKRTQQVKSSKEKKKVQVVVLSPVSRANEEDEENYEMEDKTEVKGTPEATEEHRRKVEGEIRSTPRRLRNEAGTVWKLVQKLQLRPTAVNEGFIKTIEAKLVQLQEYTTAIENKEAKQEQELEEHEKTIHRMKRHAKTQADQLKLYEKLEEKTLPMKENKESQTESSSNQVEAETQYEEKDCPLEENQQKKNQEELQKAYEEQQEKTQTVSSSINQAEAGTQFDEKDCPIEEQQKKTEANLQAECEGREKNLQAVEEKDAQLQEKGQSETTQYVSEAYITLDSYEATPSELEEMNGKEEEKEVQNRKFQVYDWTVVSRQKRERRAKMMELRRAEQQRKREETSVRRHMHSITIRGKKDPLSGKVMVKKLAEELPARIYHNTTTLTAEDKIEIIFQDKDKAEDFVEAVEINGNVTENTTGIIEETKVEQVILLGNRRASNKDIKEGILKTLDNCLSEGQVIACSRKQSDDTYRWTIILPTYHAELLKENRRVQAGPSSFYVKDNTAPKRCYKCQAWDHLEETCKNKAYCGNCGNHHRTIECTNTKPNCINCSLNNKFHQMKLDCNHPAHSPTCPTHLRKLY